MLNKICMVYTSGETLILIICIFTNREDGAPLAITDIQSAKNIPELLLVIYAWNLRFYLG